MKKQLLIISLIGVVLFTAISSQAGFTRSLTTDLTNAVTQGLTLTGEAIATVYQAFITSDGDNFITSDGDTFQVKE